MTHPSKGLREQLAAATSAKQVDKLLELSRTYEHASPATRRAWMTTATKRLRELEAKTKS